MMTKPKISIVVAITGKDRGIGHGSELLFRISDDLKRFKTLTTGHPIIMGRKTYESIGRPLPGRENIVVTRNQSWRADGIKTATSLEQAIEIASQAPGAEEIFIIGGGEIYKTAIESGIVDRLCLTVIHAEPKNPANVFFPEYAEDFTKVLHEEKRVDQTSGIPYTWLDLDK